MNWTSDIAIIVAGGATISYPISTPLPFRRDDTGAHSNATDRRRTTAFVSLDSKSNRS